MNQEFDLTKHFLRASEKHKEVIENIVSEYDTFDILKKLIALNQLNIHKKIISGLGYLLIEKYIIEYRSFTHCNRDVKRGVFNY